jgi:hypothetical protein
MRYVQSSTFLRLTYSDLLQECQNLAYEAFRDVIPGNFKATNLQLAAKRDTNFNPLVGVEWSVITPSAYNAVLASITGRLDIRVSGPLWD